MSLIQSLQNATRGRLQRSINEQGMLENYILRLNHQATEAALDNTTYRQNDGLQAAKLIRSIVQALGASQHLRPFFLLGDHHSRSYCTAILRTSSYPYHHTSTSCYTVLLHISSYSDSSLIPFIKPVILNMSTARTLGTREWERAHADTAYTSIYQMDFMIRESGVSYTQIVRDPVKALAGIDRAKLQGWIIKTEGGQTLALIAAKRLEASPNSTFDFQYYDLNNHRLARCKNEHVLLDSSSKEGAVLVRPGQTWTESHRGNKKISWRWDNDVSGYARGSNQNFSRPTSDVGCLATCLEEVKSKGVMITFFWYVVHFVASPTPGSITHMAAE
ncbi:hypothetical protein F66182_2578 [Fusarium sp. NRRL 66182]|nr:hypothetical protein F66182_2578 [Fusarium sp. NRRL 66182]